MIGMFGNTIDAEELSFLVTALDASKYGEHWNGKDGLERDSYDANGFYLDGYFPSKDGIDELLDVSREDFEAFKQARNNAKKPDVGI